MPGCSLAAPKAEQLLVGNSAPSTEQAMDHNQDREATLRENQARTRVLSKEVRHLREEKSKQVRTMPPLATASPQRLLARWTKGPPCPCPSHLPFLWALDPLQAADTRPWSWFHGLTPCAEATLPLRYCPVVSLLPAPGPDRALAVSVPSFWT